VSYQGAAECARRSGLSRELVVKERGRESSVERRHYVTREGKSCSEAENFESLIHGEQMEGQ